MPTDPLASLGTALPPRQPHRCGECGAEWFDTHTCPNAPRDTSAPRPPLNFPLHVGPNGPVYREGEGPIMDAKKRTHEEEVAAAHESVAPWAEKAIRRDERHRLALLLEQHGEAITTYTGDDSSTIKLVAYMLRLDDDDA